MRIGGADTWDAQERQRVDAVEVKADVVGELLPSCCSSCWRAYIVRVTYEAIAVGLLSFGSVALGGASCFGSLHRLWGGRAVRGEGVECQPREGDEREDE